MESGRRLKQAAALRVARIVWRARRAIRSRTTSRVPVQSSPYSAYTRSRRPIKRPAQQQGGLIPLPAAGCRARFADVWPEPYSAQQQDEQAAGYYEGAAEHDSGVGNLLENQKCDQLRNHKENRDVDPHQAIEIKAAFVDHQAIEEKRCRSRGERGAGASQSDPDERISADRQR